MLWKCCTQCASAFGKLSSGHRAGKCQFSFHSQRKAMPNYHTIALISHTSKVILKILQARLQQYVNCELPDVQAGFRKGRGAWEGLCQGDTSQSILKETNPKYSLKGLMLKLQYFGHLMRGSDSLENILIWERLKAKWEVGNRGWGG